jgi:hypothetical protein
MLQNNSSIPVFAFWGLYSVVYSSVNMLKLETNPEPKS